MDITLKRRLIIAAGIAVAVFTGWEIANESLMLIGLAGAVLLLWLAGRAAGIDSDAFVAGIVIVGYLVGNRGFAQLNVPNVPLLPGELVLGVGLVLATWRAVTTQTLPFRRDLLNLLVLSWIAVGTARMPIDFRAHSFLAVRDFAFVYYALFFFLAQAWAELPVERRWLQGCLTFGLTLTAPFFCAFLLNTEWFTSQLTVGGTPLIYFKSDVAGGFMAAGTLWFAYRYVCTRRIGWIVMAVFALVGVAVSNSRGAVVALAGGVLWLLVLRAWSVLRIVAALFAAGVAILSLVAAVSDRPFTTSPLYRAYESAASIVDVQGTRVYRATDLDDKPDNNQFRLVWWQAVVRETWTDGRWFGLGFGHDLADEFLRVYYADANDEFTVRSPHNFLLSVFGRMGVVGLLIFFAIAAAVARQTWRAGQDRIEPDSALPLWLTGWTILGSACFGVVLEGPMASIIFWIVLGLANGAPARVAHAEPAPELAAPAEHADAARS